MITDGLAEACVVAPTVLVEPPLFPGGVAPPGAPHVIALPGVVVLELGIPVVGHDIRRTFKDGLGLTP